MEGSGNRHRRRARGLTAGIVLSVCVPGLASMALTRPKAAPLAVAAPAGPFALHSPAPSTPPRAPTPPRASKYVTVYHPAGRVTTLHAGLRTRLIRRLKVEQPVVFITIDDGYVTDSRVYRFVRNLHLPVTLFLVHDALARHKPFFRAMARVGAQIEDHTANHPFLRRLSYAQQRREICRPVHPYAKMFRRRPHLFRPPYGGFNAPTLRATRTCGLGAAVLWTAEMRGGHLTTAPSSLRPGDIVLLHFRPELYVELKRLLKILRARHLGVGSLEEYLTYSTR